MSNISERSSSSQIEVYSIELDCNPTNSHNDTPTGDDGVQTEIVRRTSGATIEAWTEENSNETRVRVHDVWLAWKTAITTTNQAMHQWVTMLKDSSWFRHLYGPIIVALATASSTIVTLWPQHNSILKPEYWYEVLGVYFMHFFALWFH